MNKRTANHAIQTSRDNAMHAGRHTLCEKIICSTSYHKLVVSSFELAKLQSSLPSGYICFLQDGFASLKERQMSISMYHDGENHSLCLDYDMDGN